MLKTPELFLRNPLEYEPLNNLMNIIVYPVMLFRRHTIGIKIHAVNTMLTEMATLLEIM